MKRLFPFFFVLLVGVMSCSANSERSSLLKDRLKKGENIYVTGEHFTATVDLSEMLDFVQAKPGETQAVVKGHLVFDKCQFTGFKAYGYANDMRRTLHFMGNVIFNNCTFSEAVDFSYATIEGDFSVNGSQFFGAATFSNTWFRGNLASFGETVFVDKVKLTNSTFENRANFLSTQFHKTLIAQNAVFKGDVFFGGAIFSAYAELGGCLFGSLDLSKAVFKSTASFVGIKVLTHLNLTEASFKAVLNLTDAFVAGRCINQAAEFGKGYQLEGANFTLINKE